MFRIVIPDWYPSLLAKSSSVKYTFDSNSSCGRFSFNTSWIPFSILFQSKYDLCATTETFQSISIIQKLQYNFSSIYLHQEYNQRLLFLHQRVQYQGQKVYHRCYSWKRNYFFQIQELAVLHLQTFFGLCLMGGLSHKMFVNHQKFNDFFNFFLFPVGRYSSNSISFQLVIKHICKYF